MRPHVSFLLACFLAAGCPVPNTPSPPDADAMPPLVFDAAAPVVDASPEAAPDADAPLPLDSCGAAEVNLLRLRCSDKRGGVLGGKNKHGQDWSVICRNDADAGVDITVGGCLTKATTCAEVSRCR